MNVKELKEFLNGIDDDVEVAIKYSYYEGELRFINSFNIDKNKITFDDSENKIIIDTE